MADAGRSISRRSFLAAGLGTGLGGLSGCAESLWWRGDNPASDRLSLTVKSLPKDADHVAATIRSYLRDAYETAGIDVRSEPVPESEFYREILLEGNYDVFVAGHSRIDDLDALRGLLHSDFWNERGRQNPFHFSDIRTDDDLDVQTTLAGREREETASDLVARLAEMPPYTAVVYPERLGGADPGIDVAVPPRNLVDYLDVMTVEPADGRRNGPLEAGVFGENGTGDLNPLTVANPRIDGLLDAVYDPLVRRVDDEYVPWLASSVEWAGGEGEEDLEATVTLRRDVDWHDGRALDAADVAFTYRFVADTAGGDAASPVPAPRYRGRQSLVADVSTVDDRRVRFSFGETTRGVARRALTIPLLPEHVWESRTSVIADGRTEALATTDEEPIGSGLFAVGDDTTDRTLELEPFEDHVLRRRTVDRPAVLDGFSQYEGISVRVETDVGPLTQTLIDGEIDLTGGTVPPAELRTIRETADVSAVTASTGDFYLIGYNHQERPLNKPYVRRILSRLVDRQHVAEELLEGHAAPPDSSATLLGLTDDVVVTDDDPVVLDFPGNEPGELSEVQVRSLFEEYGYRYEEDRLIG